MERLPELSIVLPVHDEEPVLPELHRRLLSVLDGLQLSYELLYVEDGRQTSVPYDRGPRPAGRSKYDVCGMTALALTGLFSFSRRPLALVGLAGALACLGALAAVARGDTATAGLFFLGGVQLLSIWVLGQYALSGAEDARARPLYVVREALNRQSDLAARVMRPLTEGVRAR